MPSMGLQEWIIIFLIVLLIFGPTSLPKVGRALGKGIREFKDAINGIGSALEQEEAEKKKINQQASATFGAPENDTKSHYDNSQS